MATSHCVRKIFFDIWAYMGGLFKDASLALFLSWTGEGGLLKKIMKLFRYQFNRFGSNSLIILTLLCVLALFFRWPFVGAGLPFFYDEDEGHHFNRVVNMVKQGEFDPNYFHKPSLHFYLRMPAVAAGFLWNVRQGHIKSVQEIRTRDRYGLAGYAFTASHPGIVKSVRMISLLLSLALIVLTFLVCLEFSSSHLLSAVTALSLVLNPELVRYSATIGVDVLMATMCMTAVFLSLRYLRLGTLKLLLLASLFAGLAVSSKYNALPIVCVPLVAVLGRRDVQVSHLLTVAAVVAGGFLLGTPFALSSLPLFLDQLAYEIYHYGVAGHVGHSAEPGFAQAWFYLQWLMREGVGVLFCFAGLIGGLWLVMQRNAKAVALLVFPLLFSCLMISQRTNFTRNMVALVPFVLLFAVLVGGALLSKIKQQQYRTVFLVLLLALALLQPTALTMEARAKARKIDDSRIELTEWLKGIQESHLATVVVGELQLPPELYKLSGIEVVGIKDLNLAKLYQAGADRLVVPGWYSPELQESGLVEVERLFPGDIEKKRIVANPAMDVLRFKKFGDVREIFPAAIQEQALQHVVKLRILPLGTNGNSCMAPEQGKVDLQDEPYCWLQGRVGYLEFEPRLQPHYPKAEQINLLFQLMSPWENQKLVLRAESWKESLEFDNALVGKWQSFKVALPTFLLRSDPKLLFYVEQVHSPESRGLSVDNRRLGVAIESVRTLE